MKDPNGSESFFNEKNLSHAKTQRKKEHRYMKSEAKMRKSEKKEKWDTDLHRLTQIKIFSMPCGQV
jgi:hypothetical protein